MTSWTFGDQFSFRRLHDLGTISLEAARSPLSLTFNSNSTG
jgi:hypothetical protein